MTISLDQLRFLRSRAQRLSSHGPDQGGVAGVVAEVCGIQAQDTGAAALGVRARSGGLTATRVRSALLVERTVVRTWAMRGTLHLIATEDLHWLVALLGPVFIRQGRRRYAELGLDEETRERSLGIIHRLLSDRGPLTRAELAQGLAAEGIPTAGQATPHLIGHAALSGLICQGPERDGEAAYVLLEDWLGAAGSPPLYGDAACDELARRYLAAFGPAGPQDFAAWSGLPAGDTRSAWSKLAPSMVDVEIAGAGHAWMLKEQVAWLGELEAHPTALRLLPAFDSYLLGYRDRGLILEPGYARRINAGGGIIHPALLLDGRVAGTWRGKRQKNRIEVVVERFTPLPSAAMAILEAEAQDVGRFLDRPASLQIVTAS